MRRTPSRVQQFASGNIVAIHPHAWALAYSPLVALSRSAGRCLGRATLFGIHRPHQRKRTFRGAAGVTPRWQEAVTMQPARLFRATRQRRLLSAPIDLDDPVSFRSAARNMVVQQRSRFRVLSGVVVMRHMTQKILCRIIFQNDSQLASLLPDVIPKGHRTTWSKSLR